MHGVVGRRDERGRDGDLVLRAGRDVEADLADDGHVEVVHQRHLQALAALQLEVVVEGLCIADENFILHSAVWWADDVATMLGAIPASPRDHLRGEASCYPITSFLPSGVTSGVTPRLNSPPEVPI